MFRSVIIASMSAFLFSGCGVGAAIGEALGTALQQTFPLYQATRSGSWSSAAANVPGLRVGDDAADKSWRAFLSFQMAAPLPGYQVKEATLRLHQYATNGTPYGELGPMMVERVELGATLNWIDYFVLPKATVLGIPNAAIDYHDIDVTALVQNSIADGQLLLDLRLRFTSAVSVDGGADLARITQIADLTGGDLIIVWEKI